VFQDELFEPSIAQRFAAWKETPGGGHVLCRLYRITAGYYGRFQRTGRKVSQRLLWELLRDRIDGIRRELTRRGLKMERERGFLLNDHFTAHAVRHMIEHHPSWRDLFELRELNIKRKARKVIVIDEGLRQRLPATIQRISPERDVQADCSQIATELNRSGSI